MNKNRLTYIDNIRLLMIILVVVQHIAVTYSGFGSWYYIEPGEIGIVQTVLFGFLQAFTQGYSMGLLFLLAGYFVPDAYDKKGFGKFIKDRLFRLGIPTIIYMLIITPLIVFGLMGERMNSGNLLITYEEYITSFRFISGSGPLWFALALLIFTIIYALIRKLAATQVVASDKNLPAFSRVFVFVLLICICTFLIRIVQPIGTSVLNMQLCYFPQYVILFIVGIKSKRNNWLEKLDYEIGKPWLIWGISFGFVLFAAIMISGGALDGDLTLFNGGITWQSAAYALWESFVAIAMSIGLIALFKEKFNIQNKLIKIMAANAFSVYVFHSLIIVVLTLLFAPIHLIPFVKFVIVVLAGVPLSFLSVHFTIRKIPFLRKLFA